MELITTSSPMATQGSPSEVELVIDNNTITIPTPTPTIMISHNNNIISTHKHEPVSVMVIANRFLMSLTSVLTKFHAGYFRISLSLGGQLLLWKTLIETNNTNITLRHVIRMLHPIAFLALWSMALFILVLLSLLYMLRCLLFFNMVKVEFLHHVGVNYLFTPFISWLLLLQSSPFLAPNSLLYIVLWWAFTVPVVLLDVKIYGQWFTKGKRVLTMVANPTSQLSVIGNLVGAQAAANMGWKESAIFMFSLGMAHYLVLFVTLYQRLSGGDHHGLPVLLRPAFFLFFAAPCVACLAWESIVGAFDIASKMLFFLSLFLFMSLICRPTLFKKCMKRFNVAWWAYSFPVTMLALASTEYAREVEGTISNILMISLSILSFLVSLGLMVFTLLNSKMLIPENDPIGSLLNSNSFSNTRVTKSSVDL